jgi:hypothetical protein
MLLVFGILLDKRHEGRDDLVNRLMKLGLIGVARLYLLHEGADGIHWHTCLLLREDLETTSALAGTIQETEKTAETGQKSVQKEYRMAGRSVKCAFLDSP